jgi:hypothetical protein
MNALLVWGVLIAGVILLAGMAWRIWRRRSVRHKKGPHKRAFLVNRADYRLDTFSDRYLATPSGEAAIPSLPFSH